MNQTNFRLATLMLAVCFVTPAARAQTAEAAEIARVRAATSKLIQVLMEQGVLAPDKAAALLKDILGGTDGTQATAVAAPAKPAPPTVRVPYVPEFVRKEIKEEVRAELAAQAQREGWAGPSAVPSWVRELKVEGDLRTRLQHDNFDATNAPAVSVSDTNRTRALTLLNTTEDRTRLRVRARLGASASVDESWSTGIRLTTGSTSDPLSSNQTLGTYSNRFVAAFDRAYVRYRQSEQLSAVFGRFGNPWFGTELLWANDLGFDGVAVQWTPKIGRFGGFVTAAAMPVQELELSRADKWLLGLQAGAELPRSHDQVGGKVGIGLFRYTHLAGRPNAAGSSLNDVTAPAFAQKGNTYFNISSDPARPLLALASDYHLVDLSASLDMPAFGRRLMLTGNIVKNIGFDRAAVSARVGADVAPQTRGHLLRVAYGSPEVARTGDWQVFASYRRVERDAVLDAFTDSDFRLGGTDAKGVSIGASYGIGRRSAISVRYLSGDSISGAPLSIDVLQVDLSVRF